MSDSHNRERGAATCNYAHNLRAEIFLDSFTSGEEWTLEWKSGGDTEKKIFLYPTKERGWRSRAREGEMEGPLGRRPCTLFAS